ncbi:MAG: hypothetical protein KKH94_01555 [Candidatus Omnitrophica bacterium]|nr:hypothetical protein [Candidatus Omnitrophota bacterium]
MNNTTILLRSLSRKDFGIFITKKMFNIVNLNNNKICLCSEERDCSKGLVCAIKILKEMYFWLRCVERLRLVKGKKLHQHIRECYELYTLIVNKISSNKNKK